MVSFEFRPEKDIHALISSSKIGNSRKVSAELHVD
jgi:hypothetical protein